MAEKFKVEKDGRTVKVESKKTEQTPADDKKNGGGKKKGDK